MSTASKKQKILKEALDSGLLLIGSAISALSLLKALVFLLKIGLSGFTEKLIAYYRGVLQPLYDLIEFIPLPFAISEQAIDIAIFLFVGFSTSVRIYFGAYKKLHQRETSVGLARFTVKKLSYVHALIPFNLYLLFKTWWLTKNPSKDAAFSRSVMEMVERSDEDTSFLPKGAVIASRVVEKNDERLSAAVNRVLIAVALIPIIIVLFFVYNGL